MRMQGSRAWAWLCSSHAPGRPSQVVLTTPPTTPSRPKKEAREEEKKLEVALDAL